MKSLHPTIALFAVFLALLAGAIATYHHEQNNLNRKAYYECLRVTEEIAKSQQSNGSIRIVSTPTCYLR